MLVYHFTDTVRLPYILASGELQPGSNKIGGFPDPDFLWATANSFGDVTASGASAAYRNGRARLVRFTLKAEQFIPWSHVPEIHPQWTPELIARLEAAAGGRNPGAAWFCRSEPLALSECLAIDSRSYVGSWTPLGDANVEKYGDYLSVTVAGKTYASCQRKTATGEVIYGIGKIVARRDDRKAGAC